MIDFIKTRTTWDWLVYIYWAITIPLGIWFVSTIPDNIAGARQQSIDDTYTACQHSRIDNTVSEEQCGRMQDDNKLEYLCTQRNDSKDNHCWVEEK
jgi:hypothetical protein